ncbi:MAG TPA: hypothetical protein VK864_14610, partial [Longimicrobiales bacterium]|nr:hypothetical protein [Longimicrobiales bacterium]
MKLFLVQLVQVSHQGQGGRPRKVVDPASADSGALLIGALDRCQVYPKLVTADLNRAFDQAFAAATALTGLGIETPAVVAANQHGPIKLAF